MTSSAWLCLWLAAAAAGGVDGQLPTYPPNVLSFTDQDLDEGQIGGVVEFARANFETDITYYALYFGTSTSTTLSLLANLPVPSGGTKVNLGMNFPLPAGATYFLVFSANANGVAWDKKSTCVLRDKAVPAVSPAGITFTDTDDDPGQIAGRITVARAADETKVVQYALYFGMSPTVLMQFVPGGLLSKSLNPVQVLLANDTLVPAGTTHLLAYAANADGLGYTPAALLLYDRIIPNITASGIDFYDLDLTRGEISGIVTIAPAVSEAYISLYALYFARGAAGPVDRLLGSAVPRGGLSVTVLIAQTVVPVGVTHLLVKTRSVDGEMAGGISIPLVDRKVPNVTAGSLSFTDTDTDRYELGGTVTFTKASDESDVTYYRVVFLNTYSEIIEPPLATVSKGNATMTYLIPTDFSMPAGATFLCVLAGNLDGLAFVPYGRTIPLIDKAVPLHPPLSISFVDEDSDASMLGGQVTVWRAADESDVTAYTCYYGTSSAAVASSKLSALPLGTLYKAGLTGSFAIFFVSYDTALPAGATHFLAFSANADGEIKTGISAAIADRTDAFPTVAVSGLGFADFYLDLGFIGGPVTWFEPANKVGLTNYSVYLAVDSTGTLRTRLADVNVGTTRFTIPLNTTLRIDGVLKYTHVLVFCRNSYGRALTGAAVAIVDRAVPVAVVSGMAFTDLDGSFGSVGGTISWFAPLNPVLPTQFTGTAAYFADSEDARHGHSQYLGTVMVPAVSLSLPNGTLVQNFTHIVLYTKNAEGEAVVGAPTALVDLYLPIEKVDFLSFMDQDLGVGELGGLVQWREPASSWMVHEYRTYFVSSNGTRYFVGAVPVGSSSQPVPFDTPLADWVNVTVVAANPTGEALNFSVAQIADSTAKSCPTITGHGHGSPKWRIAVGPVAVAWRVKSLRFYEDASCTLQLATVPDAWPRRPGITAGAPFSAPPEPRNLHEVFHRQPERYTFWENGTTTLHDQYWWSSGGPCLDMFNVTGGVPSGFALHFDPDEAACFMGWDWTSDAVVKERRIIGTQQEATAPMHKVHCVELEQSTGPGEFAEHVALQWYDVNVNGYKTLFWEQSIAGGFFRMAYQAVLAAECAAVR